MEKELRFLKDNEFRAYTENNQRLIFGYAARYNVLSHVLYEWDGRGIREFQEIIETGAFRNVLQSPELDVIFTYNHSSDIVIARSKSGTLELGEDEKGLWFKASVPNTTAGNDLYEQISRGDIFENSFAFWVNEEDYKMEMDGDMPVRRIHNITRLSDCSAVTHAAYPETSLSVRQAIDILVAPKTLEQTENIYNDKDNREMRIKLLNLKK
jgi:HK97 family phage prohead protease